MLDAKDVETVKKLLDDFKALDKDIENLNSYKLQLIALDAIPLSIEEEGIISDLLLKNRRAQLDVLRKKIKEMI